MDGSNTMLTIRNLRVSFRTAEGKIPVVRGFDLDVYKGGITGIVGESGCGKTVSVRSILGLLDPRVAEIEADQMIFDGLDLLACGEDKLRGIRGRRISYVFQDPGKTLNPRLSVGRQIELALKSHRVENPVQGTLEAMKSAGLKNPSDLYTRLPSQLSGGQCQRVMIALAVALKPDLIIADEPTSSVDAGLQQTILDLFATLNTEAGTAVVIISHDFDVVRYLCRDIVVMYGGLVMETGNVESVMDSPAHPYSRELIRCTESLAGLETPLYSLPGRPPKPRDFNDSCPFSERCRLLRPECLNGIPDTIETDSRTVRCRYPISGDIR